MSLSLAIGHGDSGIGVSAADDYGCDGGAIYTRCGNVNLDSRAGLDVSPTCRYGVIWEDINV